AIRGANIRYRLTEGRFDEGDEGGDLVRRFGRRCFTVAQRNQAEIGEALRDRLERLALEVDPRTGPEAVHLIGQQQHVDAAGTEAFELRRGRQTIEIASYRIIDGGLIVLQAGDIVLQRTPFVAGTAGPEARQLEQGL